MSEEDLKKSTFFLVGNIPASFKSAHLRAYFSQCVEKKLFTCFHFRHRPEQLRQQARTEGTGSAHEATSSGDRGGPTTASTRCCVVALRGEEAGRAFVGLYHKKNWSHSDGSLLPGKVHISRLNVRVDRAEPFENASGKCCTGLIYLGLCINCSRTSDEGYPQLRTPSQIEDILIHRSNLSI